MHDARTLLPWAIRHSQLCYHSPPWVKVYRQEFKLPDGRVLPDFHHVDLGDYVMVVAVVDGGRLVMIREWRPGAEAVTLEVPAGLVELNELPLDAAKRELAEETGYVSEAWRQLLPSQITDPNRGCGRMHVFLALEARLQTESTEEHCVELVSFDDFMRMVRTGDVDTCVPTLAALLAWRG